MRNNHIFIQNGNEHIDLTTLRVGTRIWTIDSVYEIVHESFYDNLFDRFIDLRLVASTSSLIDRDIGSVSWVVEKEDIEYIDLYPEVQYKIKSDFTSNLVNPVHNPATPSTTEEIARAWEITKAMCGRN